MVPLALDVKVLIADLCALVNPSIPSQAQTNYDEVNKFLLDQVCCLKVKIFLKWKTGGSSSVSRNYVMALEHFKTNENAEIINLVNTKKKLGINNNLF